MTLLLSTKREKKQKIPFLEDGDIRLSESLAICRYLLNAYPNGRVFLPKTSRDIAKEDEWCCYIYGELDETALYVMRRHGELAEIYGASEAVMGSCRAYVERHLDVLEHHLTHHDYLMDQGFACQI